jgi:hypothetical protein
MTTKPKLAQGDLVVELMRIEGADLTLKQAVAVAEVMVAAFGMRTFNPFISDAQLVKWARDSVSGSISPAQQDNTAGA